MMEAYTKRMNPQREQEVLLAAQREQELREQEHATQREQELLARKQAAQEKEEPPQNFDFHQLIGEMCGIKASVEQKQKLEEMIDDKSLSNDDVSMENFKIYSNPLFDDEEIISTKIDPHYFNAESNLLESLLNQDTFIDSSPKFDYLLEELSCELAHIDPIPPRIEEADFDLEEEIRLVENLLYDNSSPPEEFNAEISDMILESLSPFPIPVEDSDSHMEEINLFLATDDLMPPGIKNDNYDSEWNIHFLEELLSNDTLPLPENESSNFDHHDDPSFL
uniref:Reverse transcriptase domain-containing protein n=1 Tax=Tanacetum cinerariifolium TaxID=118510 RepID=A0A6L2JNH3_TANCI|nr:hypothetical protein [Tanacetum cinerariifolium]